MYVGCFLQVFLERQFRKNNLQLVYDSTDGKYTVTDEKVPDARVELIVFEEDPMVNSFATLNYYFFSQLLLYNLQFQEIYPMKLKRNCFVGI